MAETREITGQEAGGCGVSGGITAVGQLFKKNNPANTDVHCLTYYRQTKCVLCGAPAVSHYDRVATCVLRSHLCYHQCTAQICGFYPQLWAINNLYKKHNQRKRRRRRRSFFSCQKVKKKKQFPSRNTDLFSSVFWS